MRQLFNKSGTMIAFFACTFFLCTFIVSVLLNSDYEDIYKQFSERAVHITIKQNNTADNALSYSDMSKILFSYPIKGAVLFDIGGGRTGYMVFNFSDHKRFEGAANMIDVNSKTPQAIIKPMYQAYCMPIDGKQTINLMGSDHEVIGLNVYAGLGGVDFICNTAGLSGSGTKFRGLTLIIDAGNNSVSVTNSFLSELRKQNNDIRYTLKSISDVLDESSGKNSDTAIVITAVLLIGLLLLINASAFTSSWINSKKSEIAARRICGADNTDIKRRIFINHFLVCATGTLIGFVLTFILSTFSNISFYIGTIKWAAGAVTAIFLIAVSGVISYAEAAKYSREQVVTLRRE